MPVWHQKTLDWVKQGRLAIVGVIQEQHPERCRLFAQWQQFGWPILHDPINVLDTTAVPIVVAIDEQGIVRSIGPKTDAFESNFLDREYATEAAEGRETPSLTPPRDVEQLAAAARASTKAEDWRRLGDSLALWHVPRQINDAVSAYEQAVRLAPNDGRSHFRLGVCLRMRHETSDKQEGDFVRAIASWEEALASNPNQYIWRRRIQQYGPRLKKPYPFYDWVTQAENDIRKRGETPVELAVRPSGAEIASPAKDFASDSEAGSSPDPGGRIVRDTDQLIQSAVAIVPSIVEPGETARIHVTFSPNGSRKAHWNNESDPLQLWVEPALTAKVSRQLHSTEDVAAAVSNEVRRLDFEVQVPRGASSTIRLAAYALYYVCEDVNGQCRYLRQDLQIEIPVNGTQTR